MNFERLTAWRKLSNLTQWLLCTIEKGYGIQFAVRPLKFRGVFSNEMDPNKLGCYKREEFSLLMKGAIYSPHESQTEFYRRNFSSEEGWRAEANLKIRSLPIFSPLLL